MKIKWDETGKRLYETGVDHAVLYPISSNGQYTNGVAWNGITSISESPSGADANPLYADNIKYLNLIAAEDFGATVEAYTYPDEWEACDGSAEIAPGVTVGQQNRKTFGLSYRTKLGNDTDGQDHGYKLHLIYGALASPSDRSYQTVNDNPDAISFSWTITTTPVEVPGHKPTACVTIDSTKVDSAVLAAIEEILYGTDSTNARLPLPAELIQILRGVIKITVEAETGTATLFGMQVSDLQSNVAVGDSGIISGTLNHVTGYTAFSSNSEQQEGHYLALRFVTEPSDAVTTVEVVGGTSGPVQLDSDMNIVLLIRNTTQTIRVVSTKDEKTTTKIFSLTGLTLAA